MTERAKLLMARREFCRAWGAGLAATLIPATGKGEKAGVLYPGAEPGSEREILLVRGGARTGAPAET
jgi:hypothetical protein